MICGFVIAKDGHTPSLIPDDFDVTIEPIHSRRELGSEDKDVDAAVGSKCVESVSDVLYETRSGLAIDYEAVIDIDRGTALRRHTWLEEVLRIRR